jgi:hypothetical protein
MPQTCSRSNRPGTAGYLKYAGKQQAELFASRLPHVPIEMMQPGDEGIGTTTKVIQVFDRAAVLHVLGFLLDAEDIAHCTRPLNTVSRSLWVLVERPALRRQRGRLKMSFSSTPSGNGTA